jgi:cytochrome c oxidase assembly factor CtaG
MINRLFHRKKHQNHPSERIIWGIWVPKSLQLAYKMMASMLRVPISVLVTHILRQWLAQNGQSLLHDDDKRHKYSDYLTEKYLAAHKL